MDAVVSVEFNLRIQSLSEVAAVVSVMVLLRQGLQAVWPVTFW